MNWQKAWNDFDPEVRDQLITGGLSSPVDWAYAFEDEKDEDLAEAVAAYAEGLCGPLVLEGLDWVDYEDELLALLAAAKRPTEAHGGRVAAVTDLQLFVDQAVSEKQEVVKRDNLDLKRLKVYNPDRELPVTWRPIKYRRRALASTAKERERTRRPGCARNGCPRFS